MTQIAPRRYQVRLYTPHPGQIPLHDSKARFKVVNCGRRFGKTLFACNEQVKFALDHNGVLCWWVAPVYRQAKIAYRLMKRALREVLEKWSDTDLRLEIINGSVIECRSCDSPDNLRGEGIHHLVVEEAAMLDGDTWYKVLRPMLSDTNGRAIFISTPRGRNWFYHMHQRGTDPLQKDYESFTCPTSANPYIPREEIEDAKKDLPEDVYEQEYEAVFHEESAGAFRGIANCIEGELRNPIPGVFYEIGWDVAKRRDFSVLSVMNISTMHIDHWYRTNQVDYTIQIEKAKEISIFYNNAHILMDSTGVGDAVLEMARNKGINADGYEYYGNGKKTLIEKLIVGIEHRCLTFPDIPVLVNELRIMQCKYTPGRMIQYEAPPGMHDDTVNSLALAYMSASAGGAIPIATSGQGNRDEHMPRAHETKDEAIQQRQDQMRRLLGDIQITGRFGNG